ncbi:SDR family NAD(P)-dependent oxidoreductase [Mucilaginibacter rubeus]|uniref:SDR family NAD(P)-dependent oxidoreductase n=1 Tax=Mucilaginibacter rubeus TaxID=2027860 RepID=A0AAE6JCT1_9SPHI|nr:MULTISPECIES: SDR family NAD(P)-dependent oxidoreductase [Mucilaginibacter]QEM02685.1 SDR family NAD(P)-dependent oxidoreductase [Mucilaginibacter rubeus]QEM15305.1 SDR family NAD(P)-dependent oxidoreductase [Mucilaginibacter gossypii]QTE41967.1 SDR family NAD(P)-dependent oxidoreductase [Mucilaginibacter rubeus]QTE48568.1 SDR family NAD(P)-dependent oxidoreductase [Mucilaginibacter rubeus]QTE59955.1 SDR family NAD(P)-dependent oxidoreductase [Mucilaginibacter rubeus]
MTQQTNKIWFVTGASRGLGRIWTEAALERGDQVAATARELSSIAALKEQYEDRVLTLELDVTNPAQVKEVVNKAHEHFGRLDIVLNNAGYPLIGTIEDGSAGDIRALYETNVIGPVSVIQAALPLLRGQGYGHILGTSSNLGHLAMPILGYYCSSKWAFEAIHESLALEVAQFGIKVTIIEPGAYATEFGSDQIPKVFEGNPVYHGFKAKFMEGIKGMERGNPAATPQALFKVVGSENPPLRFNLGSHNLNGLKAAYAERIATWEAWDEVSRSAQ